MFAVAFDSVGSANECGLFPGDSRKADLGVCTVVLPTLNFHEVVVGGGLQIVVADRALKIIAGPCLDRKRLGQYDGVVSQLGTEQEETPIRSVFDDEDDLRSRVQESMAMRTVV
jgi:hypothetical protein